MNVKGWTWRFILLVDLVIFAGITKSCAQTALRLELDYTRIPVNNTDIPLIDTLKILFVFDKNCIGIVTNYDTLALIYQARDGNFLRFVDIQHTDNQKYSIERFEINNRFLLIVAPIRPFPSRKLYSLILESL